MTHPEESFDGPEAEDPPVQPKRLKRVEPVEAPHPADDQGEIYTPPPYPMARTPASVPGRTLPSSPDDESSLLSACLIDDGETLDRAKAAGLEPRSFHDPRHEIVFGALLHLRAAQQPIETSVLASHLRDRKQLDHIGGIPFLMQISERVPTTATAGFMIDKVREQSILRNLIRASDRLKEDCYNFSGGIDEFLAEQAARVSAAANGYAPADAELKSRAFDPLTLKPRPDAIYTVSDVTICTPGNLTTIYSQAKTGKSSFIGAMMSAAMTNPTSGCDTLGVTGPNYAKKALVHFDTEQSPYDWQRLVLLSLKRAGLSAPPPWLMSFTIAGMEAPKAEKFVHSALKQAAKLHGGIHSIFIDGTADLVNDPNSPDECFPLISRLHGAAIQYDTAIINILHLNPSAKDKNDKGRGHLGSQLERKCESNLTLKKEGEVTVVVAEGRQRGRPLMPDKSPAFRWSDDAQMHVSTANPVQVDAPKVGRGRKETYSFSELRPIFPAHNEPAKRMKELYKFAQQAVPIKSESQFYNVLQRFVADGCIEDVMLPGGRGYRLVL